MSVLLMREVRRDWLLMQNLVKQQVVSDNGTPLSIGEGLYLRCHTETLLF